jgi:hypothetical protein
MHAIYLSLARWPTPCAGWPAGLVPDVNTRCLSRDLHTPLTKHPTTRALILFGVSRAGYSRPVADSSHPLRLPSPRDAMDPARFLCRRPSVGRHCLTETGDVSCWGKSLAEREPEYAGVASQLNTTGAPSNYGRCPAHDKLARSGYWSLRPPDRSKRRDFVRVTGPAYQDSERHRPQRRTRGVDPFGHGEDPDERSGTTRPKLTLAGRLDGFVDGRRVSLIAEGRGLTLLVSKVSTLFTLRRSWVAARDPLSALLQRTGTRLLLRISGVGAAEVSPRPRLLFRLLLPRT